MNIKTKSIPIDKFIFTRGWLEDNLLTVSYASYSLKNQDTFLNFADQWCLFCYKNKTKNNIINYARGVYVRLYKWRAILWRI